MKILPRSRERMPQVQKAVGHGYSYDPDGTPLELPCGHCTGCKMDKRREWAIRCSHEAQLYASNLFVSLDYAPEHLPQSMSLDYRDAQLWLKRLRFDMKGVSPGPNGKHPIRFFLSGEYGGRTGRPHWHVILFNVDYADKQRLHNGTYRSTLAEEQWGKGRVVIGAVTPASIAYCAGYTQKKRYGREARAHYEVVNAETGEVTARRPELVSMSRRPGIGAWWYERYWRDLFGRGELSAHDFAVLEGNQFKVPSYYWRRFQLHGDENQVEAVRELRVTRAAELDRSESTEERRAVREEVAARRTNFFSERGL